MPWKSAAGEPALARVLRRLAQALTLMFAAEPRRRRQTR